MAGHIKLIIDYYIKEEIKKRSVCRENKVNGGGITKLPKPTYFLTLKKTKTPIKWG
ncbi:hypothetical protein CE91St63_28520 [[Clostridium] hylemonae]|nr:hypothetical protein CE91St63_28520 [[Clostridium] hylemonae]